VIVNPEEKRSGTKPRKLDPHRMHGVGIARNGAHAFTPDRAFAIPGDLEEDGRTIWRGMRRTSHQIGALRRGRVAKRGGPHLHHPKKFGPTSGSPIRLALALTWINRGGVAINMLKRSKTRNCP
jgi:hypothetical protein